MNDQIRMTKEARNPNVVRAGQFGGLIHKRERAILMILDHHVLLAETDTARSANSFPSRSSKIQNELRLLHQNSQQSRMQSRF